MTHWLLCLVACLTQIEKSPRVSAGRGEFRGCLSLRELAESRPGRAQIEAHVRRLNREFAIQMRDRQAPFAAGAIEFVAPDPKATDGIVSFPVTMPIRRGLMPRQTGWPCFLCSGTRMYESMDDAEAAFVAGRPASPAPKLWAVIFTREWSSSFALL